MEQATQASIAAACAALSQCAQSAATKMQSASAAGAVGDAALQQRLSVLSARLQQFGQHADQLGQCAADAPAMHPRLRQGLESALTGCQAALPVAVDCLASSTGGLIPDVLPCYEEFVTSHLRLFIFAAQILTIENEREQQRKLAYPDAQSLFDAARNTSQAVVSSSTGRLVA